jgi:hypothetical protein
MQPLARRASGSVSRQSAALTLQPGAGCFGRAHPLLLVSTGFPPV